MTLTKSVPSAFGLFGVSHDVTARSVAGLSHGTPPSISFLALNHSCDNHTLVIRSSGHLVVNNNIYVNSCSGLNSTHGDAFDVFGTGGDIKAKDIYAHGGWETHAGLSVFIPATAGSPCQLLTQGSLSPYIAGCPRNGAPVQPDPFVGLIAPPSLGDANNPIQSSNCSPCYVPAEFSPPLFLDSSIGSSDGTLLVDAPTGGANASTPGGNSFNIAVESERMTVNAKNGNGTQLTFGSSAKPLVRGVLGSSPSAHTYTPINVTAYERVSNVATLKTSAPHHLAVGDWVKVNLPDNSFDGVHQVTDFPEGQTYGDPTQFSYANTGPDVDVWSIASVSRQGGVSRVKTTINHGLHDGELVSVDITSGDASFDVDPEDGATVLSHTANTFTYAQLGKPDVQGTPVKINSVQRSEGAASIVTATDPGIVTGDFGTVSAPTASSFNGDGPLIKTSGNHYTYANPGPDIAPSQLVNAVTKFARSNGTVTLTAASTTSLTAGTYVAVHVMNDSSFDGIFSVTAVNSSTGTFTYAQAGPDVATTNATSNSSWDDLAPIATYGRTGNVATVVTTTNHGLSSGDNPIVDIAADPSFDAAAGVTRVDNKTFTYPSPGPDVPATNGATGDGVSQGAKGVGTPLNVSSSNPQSTLTPDFSSAVGRVVGGGVDITGHGGTVSGPLTEVFQNPLPRISSSPIAPVPYTIPAGTTWALHHGIYYGGICIGAPVGTQCNKNLGGSCNTSNVVTSTVTMEPGIYVIAGGGFYVCGNTTLNAPGVMIYNTVDSAATSNFTAATLGQVELNTNGNVTLSGATANPYAGMTIWQGPDPANQAGGDLSLAATGTKCDGRSLTDTDVLFAHTGNGLNGISGTIYAPNDWALFNDSISGTATLTVVTGCIFINGATSTFNFGNGPQLFGRGIGLAE